MTLFHLIFFVLLGRLVTLLISQAWTSSVITGVVFVSYLIWLYWILNNNVKGEQRYNRTIWIVLFCLGIWLVQPLIFIDPDSKNASQNMENDPKIEINQTAESDIFSNFLKNLENEDFLKQEIRILSEDLAKEPDSYNYVTRGVLYLLLKKYQSGLNDMNKALKLEPDYMDAYFYRGVIRLNMRADAGSLKVKKGCKDIKTAYKAGQQDAIYWVKDNQELLKRKKCKI
ncbi:MAG: hypothetical protein JJ844_02080 [Prochlorococcus marinus CUG1435]|nr:hypothetical protein [Prochlorococcus marinus CUG1435]